MRIKKKEKEKEDVIREYIMFYFHQVQNIVSPTRFIKVMKRSDNLIFYQELRLVPATLFQVVAWKCNWF